MMQDLQHFIRERAEYLAVVYLTRRNDLVIEQMTADYGIDMLVTILRDSLPTGRVLGVQVKGRDKAFKDIQDLPFSFTEEPVYLQDLPFPVCVILFTMEDDSGYYRWLRYPDGALKHQVSLPPEQNSWHPLDKNAVGQIIDDVNAWYKAKSQSAA